MESAADGEGSESESESEASELDEVGDAAVERELLLLLASSASCCWSVADLDLCRLSCSASSDSSNMPPSVVVVYNWRGSGNDVSECGETGDGRLSAEARRCCGC